MNFRQGSKERDRSSSPERSRPVILSAEAEALSVAKGKDLAADGDRLFAEFTLERSEGLRVTRCDGSNCQGIFVQIEPCLNEIIRPSVGADLSAFEAVPIPGLIY